MATTLYMVIEHFKNRDPVPVYRRFRERGRLAPEGLRYVDSWVAANLERCYQLMETDDPTLLDSWLAQWEDLVHFEVHPVITSAEAARAVLDRGAERRNRRVRLSRKPAAAGERSSNRRR